MNCERRVIGISLAVMIAALIGAGCNKEAAETQEKAAAVAPPAAAPTVRTVEAVSPSDALVEVNGTKLTRGEADQYVNFRLQSAGDRIPPERLPEIRERLLTEVTQQFVVRNLLLEEAERSGITATDVDKSNAYARITANLPDGMTLDDAIKQSPMGETRMRAEILEGIKISKLLAGISSNQTAISAEDVAAFREENKENLVMPEKVRARHILFGVDAEDDPETKSAKAKQAEEVQKLLADGGDFAKLAAEHSSCPSKQRGGDLGAFGRGQMVKEFEDAAFAQEIDAIGPVVETKFGYHIIQVLERDSGGELSDDRVRAILERQRQTNTTRDLIERLKSEADIKFAPGVGGGAMGSGQ